MFRYDVLRRAFAQAGIEHMTDEAQAVEALGLKPRIVSGSRTNLKVTFPEDLGLVAAILAVEQRNRAPLGVRPRRASRPRPTPARPCAAHSRIGGNGAVHATIAVQFKSLIILPCTCARPSPRPP